MGDLRYRNEASSIIIFFTVYFNYYKLEQRLEEIMEKKDVAEQTGSRGNLTYVARDMERRPLQEEIFKYAFDNIDRRRHFAFLTALN